MNKLYILQGLILIATCSVYAQEEKPFALAQDRIMKAIENSDVDEVSYFLNPRYFVSKEQKELYLARAREVSNQAYIDHSGYGLSDFVNVVSGLIKCSAAALFCGIAYEYGQEVVTIQVYTKGQWFEARPHVSVDGRREMSQFAKFFYGVLGVLALYGAKQGLTDFSSVYKRTDRLKRHRDALAVEALIARLPEWKENVLIKS
jgi:hypothetical protein